MSLKAITIVPETPMPKGMIYINLIAEMPSGNKANIKIGYDLTKKSIDFNTFSTAAGNDVYSYLKVLVAKIIEEEPAAKDKARN